MWWTEMFCENHKIERRCTKFKSDTIKTRLDKRYQNALEKLLQKYKVKLSKLLETKREEVNNKFIKKVERVILNLLKRYPQDMALPKKINNKYLTYTLLKFELMKLGD